MKNGCKIVAQSNLDRTPYSWLKLKLLQDDYVNTIKTEKGGSCCNLS